MAKADKTGKNREHGSARIILFENSGINLTYIWIVLFLTECLIYCNASLLQYKLSVVRILWRFKAWLLIASFWEGWGALAELQFLDLQYCTVLFKSFYKCSSEYDILYFGQPLLSTFKLNFFFPDLERNSVESFLRLCCAVALDPAAVTDVDPNAVKRYVDFSVFAVCAFPVANGAV